MASLTRTTSIISIIEPVYLFLFLNEREDPLTDLLLHSSGTNLYNNDKRNRRHSNLCIKEATILRERAKKFAEMAHKGQTRKNSNAPYVTHPIRVAERLEKEEFSEELICAAYLHDVVEDTPYEIQDMENHFGSKVAELVAAHTEDKSKSWEERKQHTIDTIRDGSKEVKYLIVADKLDNLLGQEQDIKQLGSEVAWRNFNAGVGRQKWYNESICEAMYVGLEPKDIPTFFKEYEDLVKRVFHFS
ncbi:HD domain-containing protein [Halomonas sp. MG34]|nr:HD domain-containing protein [Halomonas sp. MG34]